MLKISKAFQLSSFQSLITSSSLNNITCNNLLTITNPQTCNNNNGIKLSQEIVVTPAVHKPINDIPINENTTESKKPKEQLDITKKIENTTNNFISANTEIISNNNDLDVDNNEFNDFIKYESYFEIAHVFFEVL